MQARRIDTGALPVEAREYKRPVFEVAEATEASLKHPDRNEDASYADAERGLIALSDGAGGHAGGERASFAGMDAVRYPQKKIVLVAEVGESQEARQERLDFEAMVRADQARLTDLEARLLSEMAENGLVNEETANAYMDTLFRIAAAAVEAESKTFMFKAGQKGEFVDPDKAPLATLMIARVFEMAGGRKAFVRSVGDSAVFVRRASGEVKRVEDIEEDSALQEWVKDGSLDQKEARDIRGAKNCDGFKGHVKTYCTLYFGQNPADPRRYGSIVTQMAGKGRARDLNVHGAAVDLGANDELFLTSDGPPDNLTDVEIAEIMGGKGSLSRRTEELVRMSRERSLDPDENNYRPKYDDMTVVAIGSPETRREMPEREPISPEMAARIQSGLEAEAMRQKQLGDFLSYVVNAPELLTAEDPTYREYVDDLLSSELGGERSSKLGAADKLDQLRLLVPETKKREQAARLELLKQEAALSGTNERIPLRFQVGDKVGVPYQGKIEGRDAGWEIVGVDAETGKYTMMRPGLPQTSGRLDIPRFSREEIELAQDEIPLQRGDVLSITNSQGQVESGWTYQGPQAGRPGFGVIEKEETYGPEGERGARRLVLPTAELQTHLRRELLDGLAIKRDIRAAEKNLERFRLERVQEQKKIDERKRREVAESLARAEQARLDPFEMKRREVESRRLPARLLHLLGRPAPERQVRIADDLTGSLEGYDQAADVYRVRDKSGAVHAVFREQVEFYSDEPVQFQEGQEFILEGRGIMPWIVDGIENGTVLLFTRKKKPTDAGFYMKASEQDLRQLVKGGLRDSWQARYDLAMLEQKRKQE